MPILGFAHLSEKKMNIECCDRIAAHGPRSLCATNSLGKALTGKEFTPLLFSIKGGRLIEVKKKGQCILT